MGPLRLKRYLTLLILPTVGALMIPACGPGGAKRADLNPSVQEKATLILHREARSNSAAMKFDVLLNVLIAV